MKQFLNQEMHLCDFRECVEATREDVESLRGVDDGTSTSTNAQVKEKNSSNIK